MYYKGLKIEINYFSRIFKKKFKVVEFRSTKLKHFEKYFENKRPIKRRFRENLIGLLYLRLPRQRRFFECLLY